MNKQLDSRGSMKTNYELHTRLKGMDSNVMQFRNQKASREWTSKGFSPLHARILRMFDQFETKFHNCWFDNLYFSAKFARAAYVHKQKIRISGPTQKSGRGLPSCVLQEEKKTPNEIRAVRGTVKAAVLDGDPDVPNLVAVSYYDQKPVHFLSTICESIHWIHSNNRSTVLKHNNWRC